MTDTTTKPKARKAVAATVTATQDDTTATEVLFEAGYQVDTPGAEAVWITDSFGGYLTAQSAQDNAVSHAKAASANLKAHGITHEVKALTARLTTQRTTTRDQHKVIGSY